jgi:CRP-like cAMP-binding protein
MLTPLPADLLKLAKPLRVKAQHTLFRIGEPPRYLYFLQQGAIRLNRCLDNGDDCTLQMVQQGFLAEASLFIEAYHCDAVAMMDCELLAFPLAEFHQHLDQPGFRDMWIRLLSQEVRRLRNQVERLSLKTANERVLHYLATEGQGGMLVLSQSKKAWAAELALSHEVLYRSLAQLQKQAKLDVEGRVIRLL